MTALQYTSSGVTYLAIFTSPLIVYAYFKVPKLIASKTSRDILRAVSVIAPLLFPKGTAAGRNLMLIYAARAIVAVFVNLLESFTPVQLGRVIDRLTNSTSDEFPWNDILAFAALRLLTSRAGIRLLETYLVMRNEEEMGLRVKAAIFNHMMSLSSDYHDSAPVTETPGYMTKVNGFVRLTGDALFITLPRVISIVAVAVTFASLFGLLFTAVFVGTLIVYIFFDCADTWRRFKEAIGMSDFFRREGWILSGSLSNWATVSYFNRIDFERERYASALKDRQSETRKRITQGEVNLGIKQMIMTVGMLCVSAIVIYQIRNHGRSTGDFVMVTTYWAQVTELLQHFALSFAQYEHYLGDMKKVVEVLSLKPTVKDKDGAKPFEYKGGSIEFHGVDFSYDKKTPVIKDVSFRADRGSTVALVGETGGGKSTIIKLLCRRYDVTSGSVKIDGQDVRDVKLRSLREHISIVPQDIAIFNEAILYNVRYGNLTATQEQVEDACKAAAIHDRIMKFPDGYNTKIGETGTRLSGGEMQRLAIARMIVKNSSIIILDEAMSSLDSETDWKIQRNLRKWVEGRTLVMVAHRLSTISHADLILVIKGGEIIEAGRQKELIEKRGHYYSMWVKQNSGLESGEELSA